MENKDQITYFADTDARNRRVRFGIKSGDRTRHVYVIGKTGMGKSTLLENMAVQDIRNGNGFAFIDPHGKTADLLLEYVPRERVNDVMYFAPFDMDYPISFNVMEDVGYDKRHLVVSGLMSTFKKIWVDAWSARMEYILGNTLLALLEYPGATLLEVNRMLADKAFRNKVVANIKDPSVRSFWVDEFAKYTDRFASEATPAIQNKIGQFTSNPLIRNIIGQPKSTFDIRKMMDDRKIMIINLSKGRVGEQNANLLGSMLITKIYLAALSRADISEKELNKLPNFYLYVDEFQSFANESFANILSEARKYKLNLTIAHQYIEQMTDEVRAAVFGNVGTLITFRVGSYDAEVLEKEFAPTFTAQDIVNLGAYQIYLRLMINGIGSQPFSARSIPPLEKPDAVLVEEIKQASRTTYAHVRQDVEELIRKNLAGEDNQSGGPSGTTSGSVGNNRSEGGGRDGSFSGSQRSGNSSRNNGHSGQNHGQGGTSNNGGGQNNRPKPKQNRVIDEKTRVELERALQSQAQTDDLNEISLKEITDKTKRVSEVQKRVPENKGPKPEHTNALKEALAAAMAKREDIVKAQPKQERVQPIGGSNHPAPVSEKSVEKQATEPQITVAPPITSASTNSVAEKPTQHQKTTPHVVPEIPEKDLKGILGVE